MAKFEIGGISQADLPALVEKIKEVFSGEDSGEIFQGKEILTPCKDEPHLNRSVVIVSYRRVDTLESVLQAWLNQVDEVFLCDCSGKFETNLPITHIKFHPDPGNKVMHAMALLTQGDFVILADDDILPKVGFAEDLYNGYKSSGGDYNFFSMADGGSTAWTLPGSFGEFACAVSATEPTNAEINKVGEYLSRKWATHPWVAATQLAS